MPKRRHRTQLQRHGRETGPHTSSAAAAKKANRVEFPSSDVPSKYEKMAKIGHGTYGEVFKARHKRTGKMVALKNCWVQNGMEGFPIPLLREINVLKMLKHENIVNLTNICAPHSSQFDRFDGNIHLVLEFCEHDLAGLLKNPHIKFTLAEIKKVMQMLFNGMFYIHTNNVLHRDMKPANILITRNGVLKIADFSLARTINPAAINSYTTRVVSLWYRPPELLLGECNYGPPIDLWGVGCIMAEMWTRTPIMKGHTEQQQLKLISYMCGSITPEVWPNVDTKYRLYELIELPKGQKRIVKDHLKTYVKDPYALDLIDKLLVLDPAQRTDSSNALNHHFFWTDPLPSDLKNMLTRHNTSMSQYTGPPRYMPEQPPNQDWESTFANQTMCDRVY